MDKKKIVFAILVIIPMFLNGQDSIYKNNHSVIVGFIQEWNDAVIQYIPNNQPGGELHFLSTQFVDSIRFQNGRFEKFNPLQDPETRIKQSERGNYFGLGILDPVIYTNLRFTYERRFGAGSFGFFIPLTIGLEDAQYYTERSIKYRIGLGINFHVPMKQGKSIYAIGLGMYGGRYYGYPYYYYSGEPGIGKYTFFTLTNSHSLRIHIGEKLILAPGFDFTLVGSDEQVGIALFSPYLVGLRFDLIFNL